MVKDLKVLELASVLAGPSVGQFFAELGAEVIKVESLPAGGDVTRTWRVKDERTDDRSAYFCSVNWGKKSIAIDLNRPEGKQIVHELARKSDIIIASYKAGDAKKLSVDYETVCSINPKIIYGQITGFGPDNSRVGYDAVIQAESGFMYVNGEPGGASLKMPVALMDILAAHQVKEGILLALLERASVGQGQLVEVSLIQAAISSLANQATNWLVGGVVPQKQGSEHPNIAPYGDLFKTVDGYEILLAIGSDRQFAGLCEILGIRQTEAISYQTNEDRVRNRNDLKRLVQDKIKMHSFQTLIASFQNRSIPYGIVKNMKDVFDSPEAKDLIVQSNDRMGVRSFVANTRRSFHSHFPPPPHLGEHTQEILLQSLAYSSKSIQSMRHSGIIL